MTVNTHIPIKTKLELALGRFEQVLKRSGKEPNADQLRHINAERGHIKTLAQITVRLEEYEQWVEKTSYENLLCDDTHDSDRLGKNLRAVGRSKPTDRYDAHAIVSGKHTAAGESRIKLAEYQIGLDEPDNGVWLPRGGDDARKSNNWATPKSVPHSRIHRKSYYDFVQDRLRGLQTGNAVRVELQRIGDRLTAGALPPNILEEMKYDDLQNS